MKPSLAAAPRNSAQTSNVGAFVTVEGTMLGRGRIVDVVGVNARLSWFDTPLRPSVHEAEVPFARLNEAPLYAHQRVYHFSTSTGVWRVGRIDVSVEVPGHQFGVDEPLYWVAFPNKELTQVRRSELRVRWNRPIEDPGALLGSHCTDTPFWHSGRSRLMQALMNQRAACGGLTGLLSASIELEAHQHRVVHAVLNDPVQRYLLADEVGLGKTIEAGAILRQYLLEHPEDGRALVVVPPHLMHQWEEELRSCFHLGGLLGDQVHLITLDEVGRHAAAPGMVIVDEAHHPAALANSASPRDRQRYTELARIAGQAPRLLLLSATPVLRNEDGFLAMLHLLDPAAYPLQDREGFRRRVAQRQAVAEHLADLADDAAPMFMADALDGLEETLPDDARLSELVAAARPLVDEDVADPRRLASLSALRTHIGELYRLHRRLLRNRRSAIDELLLQRAGAEPVTVSKGSGLALHQALEEWRGDALIAASRDPALQDDAAALWWLLLQGALSHPRFLAELVKQRLTAEAPPLERYMLDAQQLALLRRPMLFQGEVERLRDMLVIAEADADPRVDALLALLQNCPSDPMVVFIDRPEVADAVFARLSGKLGTRVRRHRNHEDVTAFMAQDALALICDRTAEEGLNLQRSRATLLHYDLPLSPNRIEQRIGRIDRYGARKAARSLFFLADEPYTRAWQRCLDEDVGVFSRSVASLQYLLDDYLHLLARESFEVGLEAFALFSARLRDEESGLDKEFERIRHQESLDALEADPAVRDQFDAIEALDLEHDSLQQELEAWLVSRLQFERRTEDEHGHRVRYLYLTGGDRRQTLVPVDDWLRFFSSSLDDDRTRKFFATPVMTWSRRQAARNRLPLIRLGSPLFDGAWDHARYDDRGIAFRMWRYRPDSGFREPLLALRFDFLVEANPTALKDWLRLHPRLSEPAVRRQLDALLQPAFFTVFINDQLEPIDDPRTVALLRQDYDDRRRAGRDTNLRPDRWIRVQEQVHRGDWGQLVRDAESSARRVVTEALELRRRCEEARERLHALATRREAQRIARLQRMEGAAADAERQALDVEVELHKRMGQGLVEPQIRLDAAGAIVLADFDPFSGGGND
jgi:ATP-dependent helicase HepA